MDDYKREVVFIPPPVEPPSITVQQIDPNLPLSSFTIPQVNIAPVNVPALLEVNLPGETNKP